MQIALPAVKLIEMSTSRHMLQHCLKCDRPNFSAWLVACTLLHEFGATHCHPRQSCMLPGWQELRTVSLSSACMQSTGVSWQEHSATPSRLWLLEEQMPVWYTTCAMIRYTSCPLLAINRFLLVVKALATCHPMGRSLYSQSGGDVSMQHWLAKML